MRRHLQLRGDGQQLAPHCVDWMPFAGLRVSGHGVGGIPDTVRHEMQVRKMMVMKSAEIKR